MLNAYPLSILYTNHRGETRWRMIVPKRIWVGQTQWHPQPQWLLTALDCEDGRVKDFAFGEIERILDPQCDYTKNFDSTLAKYIERATKLTEDFEKWVISGAAQSPPPEIFKGPILAERHEMTEKEFREFKGEVKNPESREKKRGNIFDE